MIEASLAHEQITVLDVLGKLGPKWRPENREHTQCLVERFALIFAFDQELKADLTGSSIFVSLSQVIPLQRLALALSQ